MKAPAADSATNPVEQYVGLYAPQVRLFPSTDPEETYGPCSVEWFLEQVQLISGSGNPVGPPVPQSALPTKQSTPTPYLQMPGSGWTQQVNIRTGDLSVAKAYVHIMNVPNTSNVYDIQYWLFYALRGYSYARFEAPGEIVDVDFGLSANATQYQGVGEHQGDWKHVTVRVDGSGNVLGIYFAQHTGGFWRLPGEYDTVEGHPIVYSARNTHSCLPSAGRFDQVGTAYSFSGFKVSLLELTEDGGSQWNTWENYEIVDDTNPDWLSYAGQWGPTEQQLQFIYDDVNLAISSLPQPFRTIAQDSVGKIVNLLSENLQKSQSGPDTPKTQHPWTAGDGNFNWSSIQHQSGYSTSGGPVSAVYFPEPEPTHLDLFMAGTNGNVYTIAWDATQDGWGSTWSTILSDSLKGQAGMPVTAIYRPAADPAHLDLFCAGNVGGHGWIYTIGWTDGTGWDGKWTSIAQGTGYSQPGGLVTAIYRPGSDPLHLDLFMAGTNGWVYTIGWTDGTGWDTEWTSIQHGSGYSTSGGPVTAVYRPGSNPLRLDIFMTGTNGWAYTIGWTDGIGWDTQWTSIAHDTGYSNGGSTATPVYRLGADPAHLDLFIAGTNGKVYTIGFTDGVGWDAQWNTVASDSLKGQAGMPVTATYRPDVDPVRLDLFCAGNVGSHGWIYTIGWTGGIGWDAEWTSIAQGTGYSKPGGLVTAVSRDPDFYDLFMAGTNGWVYTIPWFPLEG